MIVTFFWSILLLFCVIFYFLSINNLSLICTIYLVGSSKNITGGLLTSSRAIASLLRCPPERLLLCVFSTSDKPMALIISSTWKNKMYSLEIQLKKWSFTTIHCLEFLPLGSCSLIYIMTNIILFLVLGVYAGNCLYSHSRTVMWLNI